MCWHKRTKIHSKTYSQCVTVKAASLSQHKWGNHNEGSIISKTSISLKHVSVPRKIWFWSYYLEQKITSKGLQLLISQSSLESFPDTAHWPWILWVCCLQWRQLGGPLWKRLYEVTVIPDMQQQLKCISWNTDLLFLYPFELPERLFYYYFLILWDFLCPSFKSWTWGCQIWHFSRSL